MKLKWFLYKYQYVSSVFAELAMRRTREERDRDEDAWIRKA